MSELSVEEFELTEKFSGKVAFALAKVSENMYLKTWDDVKAGLEKSGFKFSTIEVDNQKVECLAFYREPVIALVADWHYWLPYTTK